MDFWQKPNIEGSLGTIKRQFNIKNFHHKTSILVMNAHKPKDGHESFEYLELQFYLSHLSLTLQHGSMISSLAAMFATHPLTIVFRYTIGVFPISCMT